MKKTLLIILTTFCISLISAQGKVQIGLRGGFNIANINGDSSDQISIDPRLGVHFGLTLEVPVNEIFSFQPELTYSTQGATFDDSDDFGLGGDVDIDGVLRYDYINLPLIAKFYVAEGFSLEFGPQIGFLVNSEVEVEASFQGQTDTDTQDVKDLTSSVDFGVNFGLGYKLNSGLNFGLRYNLGISNVNDGEASNQVEDRNGVLQLSLGYFFR